MPDKRYGITAGGNDFRPLFLKPHPRPLFKREGLFIKIADIAFC